MIHQISSYEFRDRQQVIDLLIEHSSIHWINCTFTRLDLAGINFKDCVFDACTMIGTRITKAESVQFFSCDLTNGRFAGADLRNAKAIRTKMTGIDLIGAHVTLNCDLFGGFYSTTATDHYKLLKWALLMMTPFTETFSNLFHANIPESVKRILDQSFQRDPSAKF